MNINGITNQAKFTHLKAYVFHHHPDIIFLQEAFPGRSLHAGQAPPLADYVPYVHRVINGLLTYIHSSVTHCLLLHFTDNDMTFQLFDVAIGNGALQLCNVYSAPAKINLLALPPWTVRGIVYMRDFNARHVDLGNLSGNNNTTATVSLTMSASTS